MSKDTKIQWTDYTWSPWLGCRKVSPGCENCYITETTPFRVRKIKHGAERVRTSESYWKQPRLWDRKAANEGKRPRVFPSLCDPFDSEVLFEWFKDFMDLIVHCPNLDWLLLTKRPQEAVASGQAWAVDRGYNWTGFPPNVWLGVSVEDQKRADERIPILLSIPARVRFLSVEPMLEPIDFSEHLGSDSISAPLERGEGTDWVIVGGESGKNARPCNVDWIRNVVRQCKGASVPCFVKQMGSHPCCKCSISVETFSANCCEHFPFPIRHPKGGDPAEWSEDLRILEFPATKDLPSDC